MATSIIKEDVDELAEVLKPDRSPNMSPKMIALLGYLLGQEWTNPQIEDVTVSSGVVLCRHEGEIGMNRTIGAREDVARNLREWFALHDMTDDQEEALRLLVQRKFGEEISRLIYAK